MERVEEAMKTCIQRLGYSKVKKEQKEAILKFVIEGQDIFLCLPTGYGKSLFYYSMPVLFDILAEKLLRGHQW